MYLIFDTETTGFLAGNNPSEPKQPHVVQLGAALLDSGGKVLKTINRIAKPNNYEIPKPAADVHGITTELALKEGVPLQEILEEFDTLICDSQYIVCHNVQYDGTVLEANYYKLGLEKTEMFSRLKGVKTFCTMSDKEIRDWCAIPPTQKMRNAGRFHYKTPNLTELHIKCFGEGFGDAHNAFADVKATANVFFHLKKLGIVKI